MGRKFKIQYYKGSQYQVTQIMEDFDEVWVEKVFEGTINECNEFVINNK